MKIKRYYPLLLFICMLIIGSETKASDWEVTLGGWSNHMSEDKNYNETHNTVGVRYKYFEVMTLENSFYRRSWLIAGHPQYKPTDWLSLGLRLGLVSGYNDIIEPWVVQPTMTAYYKHVGVEFGYLPDGNKHIFTVSGKIRF